MMRRNRHAGQGLLEAIIAIGIILTATTASLTLIVSSVEANKGVRERFVAINLAREALEVVRMTRDSNWLANREWSSDWAQSGATINEIAVFSPGLASPWSFFSGNFDLSDPRTIMYRASGRFIQQPGAPTGSESGYRRLITVAATESPSSYLATVQVSYSSRGQQKIITLQERFTDWKP